MSRMLFDSSCSSCGLVTNNRPDIIIQYLNSITRKNNVNTALRKATAKFTKYCVDDNKAASFSTDPHSYAAFLSHFKPMPCVEPPRVTDQPLHDIRVNQIFCRCPTLRTKTQSVHLHVSTDPVTDHLLIKMFGCPWYTPIVMANVKGTPVADLYTSALEMYWAAYYGKQPVLENLDEETFRHRVQCLRFAAIIYNFTIEDMFYKNKHGHIKPERIHPSHCLQFPSQLTRYDIEFTLMKVFGFKKVKYSINANNGRVEELVTYKRTVFWTKRHGPLEDLLGYITPITSPRGFYNRDGKEELTFLMSWNLKAGSPLASTKDADLWLHGPNLAHIFFPDVVPWAYPVHYRPPRLTLVAAPAAAMPADSDAAPAASTAAPAGAAASDEPVGGHGPVEVLNIADSEDDSGCDESDVEVVDRNHKTDSEQDNSGNEEYMDHYFRVTKPPYVASAPFSPQHFDAHADSYRPTGSRGFVPNSRFYSVPDDIDMLESDQPRPIPDTVNYVRQAHSPSYTPTEPYPKPAGES